MTLTLHEQIEALQRRADDLFEQRIRVLKQKRELEGQLENVRHVRVGSDSPTRRMEPLSPVFAAKITDYLEDHPGSAVSDVADGIASTPQRVSDALKRLEATDTVKRTGIKRGTKWFLSEDDSVAAQQGMRPDARDARALVRDIAIELSAKGGVFVIGDVEQACDLSSGTILRWLRYWVQKGVLETTSERQRMLVGGHWRNMPVRIYAYVEPKSSPLPERRRTPEEELKGKEIKGHDQGGGGPPRWYRRLDQKGRAFVAEVEAAGCKVEAARNSGHVKVMYHGSYVGALTWLVKHDSTSDTQLAKMRQELIEKGVPLSSSAIAA